MVWWAEVTSGLAETPDPADDTDTCAVVAGRLPQLVWTTWRSEVRWVAPAQMGVGYRSATRVARGRGQNDNS